MKQVLGVLTGLFLLSATSEVAAEDNEVAFDRIARCVGYLMTKVELGKHADNEQSDILQLGLAGKNTEFFVLAGGIIGDEMQMTDEAIFAKYDEEFKAWVDLIQSGDEIIAKMTNGMIQAYQIECFEGGSIYKAANDVITAAGLSQQ